MYKRILTVFGSVALLAACAGEPTIQTGDDAETIMDGSLNKVDNSRADAAYVDPNVNFAKYNKVLIMPLGVDNVEITQPSTGSITHRKDWELTDKDKKQLQELFHEAMVKQLERKDGYPVVTEPGDDVLEIVAKLTAIAPSGPKDDMRSRPVGRTRVYTEGAGAMAVAVALGDSETGEVLALFKDSRNTANGSLWGSNNSVSNISDVRRMFTSWASQIRASLDKVHGKK